METVKFYSEKEITQNNALIAEFLGFKKELFYQCSPDEDKSKWEDKCFGFYDLPFNGGYDMAGKEGVWFAQTALKFHSDWNWLMSVVEKIEQDSSLAVMFMKNGWDNRGEFQVGVYKCFNMEENRERKPIVEVQGNQKMETVYLAVLEYIKLYKKTKHNNQTQKIKL